MSRFNTKMVVSTGHMVFQVVDGLTVGMSLEPSAKEAFWKQFAGQDITLVCSESYWLHFQIVSRSLDIATVDAAAEWLVEWMNSQGTVLVRIE